MCNKASPIQIYARLVPISQIAYVDWITKELVKNGNQLKKFKKFKYFLTKV
jgi:hypothetical protein